MGRESEKSEKLGGLEKEHVVRAEGLYIGEGQDCISEPSRPQPYGEQATGPLKQNGVSILALDPLFFIQYKVVTSLKQTAGGNQRFAHICDLPGGVHVASSALDE